MRPCRATTNRADTCHGPSLPMLLCTLACEKGLSICGAAAEGAAGCSGCGSVADVCASMTALQSSPSTAAIRFNLRRKQSN